MANKKIKLVTITGIKVKITSSVFFYRQGVEDIAKVVFNTLKHRPIDELDIYNELSMAVNDVMKEYQANMNAEIREQIRTYVTFQPEYEYLVSK